MGFKEGLQQGGFVPLRNYFFTAQFCAVLGFIFLVYNLL